MKCNQCGTEFEGKFCPECGAKTQAETSVTPPPIQQTTEQPQQQFYQQPVPMQAEIPQKKKKPFFKRWWFIGIVAVAVIAIVGIIIGGGGKNGKNVWSDMILGDMLPEPPANKGEIYDNSTDVLWIDINNISDKQYADYVQACKEKGFTIDEISDSFSFEAFNDKGYKLSLSHYDSDADMEIELNAPMEFGIISWPSSTAGKLLPTPKSTTGKFSYEHDDNFFVYVGNTSKADFDAYVAACSDKGFTVDYDKGDTYYYADNADGWHISLKYEGNNVMSINIDSPDDEESNDTTSSDTTTPSTDTPSEPDSSEEPDKNDDGLDPDFKAAMDSYETFMDEYVAFMKKYAESDGTDLSILTDYADYMSKYADFVEDFEKWEDEDLNAAETAYYLEVQTRVTKKLLEVAE